MKWSTIPRLLLAGLLLFLLVLGLGGWLLGSSYGRRHLEQMVRERLAHNSELVLAPFEVDISLWRDFPHVTASLHHLALTDTAYRQRVPVFSVGRADLRLELAGLLRGRLRVSRLTVSDVDFREQVDVHGRSWGLHGKKRGQHRGDSPPLDLSLDSLLVRNFRISSRNDYSHSAFGATVRQARLTVRIRQGVLHTTGTLTGALDYLRNAGGTLFEKEPVWARVHYRYAFKAHQGTVLTSRATLNGDTIRIRGTHTTALDQPGALLNLTFAGYQPLTEVLRAALPETVQPYLAGAVSPSKAHIRYTIQGLSGPTTSPHNVLRFGLRGARLTWPDSSRRINHWDLLGTYDNGPGHSPQTTSLRLNHCRINSSAGRLDATLLLLDFTRPFVNGRVRGRTELAQLAAVVSPGVWRARRGTAEMDVRLRGLLPPAPNRRMVEQAQKSLSVRGTLTLRDASFVIPDRGADIRALNVRVGLHDNIWRLTNASGVLDQMRFRATATTTDLFDYLIDQHATTQISGNFAVDQLQVVRLRELLRPIARRPLAANGRPGRARPTGASVANLGSSLIPKGVRLNVNLRCNRLVLPADTLTNLAVSVRHDGRTVQLTNLAGELWGGQVRGTASWPTDTLNRVAPIDFRLGVHFNTINYRRFLVLLARPPQRSAKAPASPALRELLLAANGQVTCDVTTVQLPDGENLRGLRLQLNKTGARVQLPFLRFATTRGGVGEATASARVAGGRLVAAEASLDLRYETLDVQKLLLLLASFNPKVDPDDDDDDELDSPDSLAVAALPPDRAARRAARAARRAQLNSLPARKPDGTIISNGILTAVLRVQADNVRYAALTGRQFRLVSHLSKGEARLDDCSLEAFEGRLSLRGRMITDAGRRHHPLHVQMQLQDIQLPAFFGAATAMHLNVLGADNIRGTLRCSADIRTDLDATFLPVFDQTLGYLKTDIRDLELLNVEAFSQALRFMKQERTSHLFFEPVSTEFLLNRGELLIPDLDLNSNLTNLQLSGRYFLDGRADLYVGLNPMQAFFGNNEKRVERIRNNEPMRRAGTRLTYVGLRRLSPGTKYKVRPFQRAEQRQQQSALRQEYHQLLLTQRLDTTLRLLRPQLGVVP